METRDYVRAIYAFQLKGTGKQYPIAPGQYAVIAADAVNHKLYCSNAADLSPQNPDLSHAPGEPHKLYETFNALGNDYDVAGVPNFENIMPGRTIDFLIALTHNAVVIAEGGDYPIDENNYMYIPIDKVIDGVEYSFESLRHLQGDDGARRRGIRRNRHPAIQRRVDRAAGRGARYEQLDVRFRQYPPPDAGILPWARRIGCERDETPVCDYLMSRARGSLVYSCGLDKPDDADGRCVLVLQAVDTSGVFSEDWTGVAGAKVEITSSTFAYKNVFTADEAGRLVIEGLPMGDYYIQASMRDEEHEVLLTGQKKRDLRSEAEVKDTLFMSFVPVSPIVINEIYYAGCNGSSFYYYDQFVELYNSTNDTLYLDGYIVCRSQQSDSLTAAELETVDFALAYYMYQFPGSRGVTHECPIGPGEYLVLASDAVNHHYYAAPCASISERRLRVLQRREERLRQPSRRQPRSDHEPGVRFLAEPRA